MKKTIALIICILIAFALPLVAFAEEDTTAAYAEETTPVAVTTAFVSEAVPEDGTTPSEAVDEIVKTTSEKIVAWVKKNYEEIWVIVWSLLIAIVIATRNKILDKTVKTLNNNAVSVSENSTKAIKDSNEHVIVASAVIEAFKEEYQKLLADMKVSAEDRKALEAQLAEVTALLKTAKDANVELANEVAELLVLANIPNSKKEELYKRHRAAVDAIASAESTEVIADDGKEA